MDQRRNPATRGFKFEVYDITLALRTEVIAHNYSDRIVLGGSFVQPVRLAREYPVHFATLLEFALQKYEEQ